MAGKSKNMTLIGESRDLADVVSNSLRVIDGPTVDSGLDSGRMFLMGYTDTALATPGTIDFLIYTGSSKLYVNLGVAAGGQCTAALYEDTTLTEGEGTQLTPVALNRSNILLPSFNGEANTTISAVGTLLGELVIPGGTRAQAVGTATAGADWVLEANTYYLLRVVNASATTIPVTVDAVVSDPGAA